MDFYSESYFKDITARTSILEQRTFSADSVRAPLDTKFDVFLSYNINDIEVVKGLYYYLKKKGVRVYLDCIVDPDMKRNETDKQTAERSRAANDQAAGLYAHLAGAMSRSGYAYRRHKGMHAYPFHSGTSYGSLSADAFRRGGCRLCPTSILR